VVEACPDLLTTQIPPSHSVSDILNENEIGTLDPEFAKYVVIDHKTEKVYNHNCLREWTERLPNSLGGDAKTLPIDLGETHGVPGILRGKRNSLTAEIWHDDVSVTADLGDRSKEMIEPSATTAELSGASRRKELI